MQDNQRLAPSWLAGAIWAWSAACVFALLLAGANLRDAVIVIVAYPMLGLLALLIRPRAARWSARGDLARGILVMLWATVATAGALDAALRASASARDWTQAAILVVGPLLLLVSLFSRPSR